MVVRLPLVLLSGQPTELPPGDTVYPVTVGVLTAGSGLTGGGSLSSTSNVSVALAANPSGLIFVNNQLAVDGSAQRAAESALASGNTALSLAASGITASQAANTLSVSAIASGSAAISALSTVSVGLVRSFTAASSIVSGYAVGLDDTGRVQAVRQSGSVQFPTVGSFNNFIGIAQNTAASGSPVSVRLPGSYDSMNTGLTPGAVYYVNPVTSGITTTSSTPTNWSGAVAWGPIGRAVNSTTLILTDMR